ncbi:Cytidine deaminase-like [Ceraceosorus bombacis]|uniref:Cytidine deaminase-like n=1 Tax=Ceraceosorus bombacis TaxID=401625 RepID=A0A0N7LAH9_9BASI|nr:Cytidine deaminase-like [Ceraceosorus bombacis]
MTAYAKLSHTQPSCIDSAPVLRTSPSLTNEPPISTRAAQMISSRRINKVLQLATAEAARSGLRRRHGAVILKGGKVLSSGHNLTRPRFSGDAPTNTSNSLSELGKSQTAMAFSMHAEMSAISNALGGARPPTVKLGSVPLTLRLQHTYAVLADTDSTSARRPTPFPQEDAELLKLKSLARKEQMKCQKSFGSGSSASSDAEAADAQQDIRNTSLNPKHKPKPKLKPKSEVDRQEHTRPSEATQAVDAVQPLSCTAVDPQDSQSPGPTLRHSASPAAQIPNVASVTGSAPSARLRGADIYVVRLQESPFSRAELRRKRREREQRRRVGACSDAAENVNTRFVGSEHINEEQPACVDSDYADSRPCWRCIQWCRWAGIKRAFWTTKDGRWEGAKISDLVAGSSSLHITRAEMQSHLWL